MLEPFARFGPAIARRAKAPFTWELNRELVRHRSKHCAACASASRPSWFAGDRRRRRSRAAAEALPAHGGALYRERFPEAGRGRRSRGSPGEATVRSGLRRATSGASPPTTERSRSLSRAKAGDPEPRWQALGKVNLAKGGPLKVVVADEPPKDEGAVGDPETAGMASKDRREATHERSAAPVPALCGCLPRAITAATAHST